MIGRVACQARSVQDPADETSISDQPRPARRRPRPIRMLVAVAGVAITVGLIAAVPEFRHAVSLAVHGNLGSLRAYIRGLGVGGLGLLMALMLIHAVIFYPSEVVTATAGFVYGFVPGAGFAVVGWLASGLDDSARVPPADGGGRVPRVPRPGPVVERSGRMDCLRRTRGAAGCESPLDGEAHVARDPAPVYASPPHFKRDFWTFPIALRGNESTMWTSRGRLCEESVSATCWISWSSYTLSATT